MPEQDNTHRHSLEDYKQKVYEDVIDQMQEHHRVDYVCDTSWVVSFVQLHLREWCETNDYILREQDLEHIAPSGPGTAPKFRYRASAERKPPPSQVYYVLDGMPEDAANVIPHGSIIHVRVDDVEQEDASHVRVVLKYEGHE